MVLLHKCREVVPMLLEKLPYLVFLPYGCARLLYFVDPLSNFEFGVHILFSLSQVVQVLAGLDCLTPLLEGRTRHHHVEGVIHPPFHV